MAATTVMNNARERGRRVRINLPSLASRVTARTGAAILGLRYKQRNSPARMAVGDPNASYGEHRHSVLLEPWIVCDDRQSLERSLGDEHPVEWVAVMQWQLSGKLGVSDGDR
jgi:hypothetical protein